MSSPLVDAPASTTEKLLLAAWAEFNENGYAGTDSNKIARRAGFAPQTFYRWFADKTAVFLAVYERWQQEEWQRLQALLAVAAPPEALAAAVLAQHQEHRLFRRSLRQLAVEDAAVRAARTQSRQRQLAFLAQVQGPAALDPGQLAALLLQLERLADGLAEEEFADLGLVPEQILPAMAALLRVLLPPGSR